MRPLWLDYQAPPPGQQRPGYVLLAVAAAATLLLIALNLHTGGEIAAHQQQVARLRQALERSATSAQQPAALPSTAQALARWEAFFAALEQAGDESVTLLSLAPGSKEIVIAGEAKDLDSALDYVKRLQAAPVLADAHLTEYAVDKEQARHPIRFSVLAQWKGMLS